jgi:hypothetical protein
MIKPHPCPAVEIPCHWRDGVRAVSCFIASAPKGQRCRGKQLESFVLGLTDAKA